LHRIRPKTPANAPGKFGAASVRTTTTLTDGHSKPKITQPEKPTKQQPTATEALSQGGNASHERDIKTSAPTANSSHPHALSLC
jgi:hypothetical protein